MGWVIQNMREQCQVAVEGWFEEEISVVRKAGVNKLH